MILFRNLLINTVPTPANYIGKANRKNENNEKFKFHSINVFPETNLHR